MKNFFEQPKAKVRTTLAMATGILGCGISVYTLILLLKEVFSFKGEWTQQACEAVYSLSTNLFLVQIFVGILMGIACRIYETPVVTKKVGTVATCGMTGMLVFLFYGGVCVISGFSAGYILFPLFMGWVTIVILSVVFCITSYYNSCLFDKDREKKSTKDADNPAVACEN